MEPRSFCFHLLKLEDSAEVVEIQTWLLWQRPLDWWLAAAVAMDGAWLTSQMLARQPHCNADVALLACGLPAKPRQPVCSRLLACPGSPRELQLFSVRYRRRCWRGCASG
jgi:hypothetical protein